MPCWRRRNTLRERFPYYYVQAKAIHTSIFPVLNTRPVVVRNTWEPALLNSKDVNYHMMTFKYEGNRLDVEICHSITDGAALFTYVKSLLYCYLSRVTGKQFDPTGFRLPPLPDGVVPESESGNPYANWDIDNAHKPEAEKLPAMDSYQLSEPPADGNRQFQAAYLRLPEDQVMAFCKENGATPIILMSVLLTRAVHRIDPSNEKTVSTLIAVDPKAILGAEDSYYNCINQAFVDFPGDHTYDDIREMCVDAWNQLSAQVQQENVLFKLRVVKERFEKMANLPVQVQMKVYSDYMKGHFATFSVSYARTHSFGPLDEYIKEIYVLTDPCVTDIMFELTCLNHSFFIGFFQDEGSEAFFEAFLAELDAIGISHELLRKEPLRLCGVRYDGVEGLDLP